MEVFKGFVSNSSGPRREWRQKCLACVKPQIVHYFLLLTRLHYKLNLIFFVFVKAKLAARGTLGTSLSPHGSVWWTAVPLVLWWECSLEMRTSVPSALSFLCHPTCGHHPRNALCFGSLRLWASAFPLSHPHCPLSSMRVPLGSCLWPHALWLSLSRHHCCRPEPAEITLCCGLSPFLDSPDLGGLGSPVLPDGWC